LRASPRAAAGTWGSSRTRLYDEAALRAAAAAKHGAGGLEKKLAQRGSAELFSGLGPVRGRGGAAATRSSA
jgi:hypothetical protein